MFGDIDAASAAAPARPQMVVAHFPFYAAGIDSITAGTDAFLENFVEDRLMQDILLLRGE